MIYQWVLGGIVSFLLGFLLLDGSRGKRVKSGAGEDLMEKMKDECFKSSGNGECRLGFGVGTDVIVVGAGVAGSALAHTLAKVIVSFTLSLMMMGLLGLRKMVGILLVFLNSNVFFWGWGGGGFI